MKDNYITTQEYNIYFKGKDNPNIPVWMTGSKFGEWFPKAHKAAYLYIENSKLCYQSEHTYNGTPFDIRKHIPLIPLPEIDI